MWSSGQLKWLLLLSRSPYVSQPSQWPVARRQFSENWTLLRIPSDGACQKRGSTLLYLVQYLCNAILPRWIFSPFASAWGCGGGWVGVRGAGCETPEAEYVLVSSGSCWGSKGQPLTYWNIQAFLAYYNTPDLGGIAMLWSEVIIADIS